MTSLERACEVAERMSDFSDLLDKYGQNSVRADDFMAMVKDQEILRLCTLARRVQAQMPRTTPSFDFRSLFEEEESPLDRAWRLMVQGGGYTLLVLPHGKNSPVESYTMKEIHPTDLEAQQWARSVLHHASWSSYGLRTKGMLTRLGDGRRFVAHQIPSGGKLSTSEWQWHFRRAGRNEVLDYRCFLGEP